MKHEKYYPTIRQQQCVLCGKAGNTLCAVQTIDKRKVYAHGKCLGDNYGITKDRQSVYRDLQE